MGFELSRLKTGTPPRIDGRSVNLDALEIQYGDDDPVPFSFMTDKLPSQQEQLTCWIGYTDPTVHEALRGGFDRSPMFNGRIKSVGPRYCPSIEDKIHRFADRDRHQLFLEPEGWNTYEMYLNGFSTSLPEEVQIEALNKIEGFEKARMMRPGYAIEYDYVPPHQIKRTMETKIISGLFFAGQINGTTGYEEAACQGLMAGINASLTVQGKDPFVLLRSQGYIGVLIDDLISKGTEEPYRMFTSRAEHRILLRQDNADQRLTKIGHSLGLVTEERYTRFQQKMEKCLALEQWVESTSIKPEQINPLLESMGKSPIKQSVKATAIIGRPEISLEKLIDAANYRERLDAIGATQPEIMHTIETQFKYAGYIEKEFEMVEELKKQEELTIPESIHYNKIKSLSSEGKSKLEHVRPETLGQASRISGVSQSDLAVLLVYLKG
jgi:tRNA uridine 5-carboxymethylaminomethyl modification enzyme